MYQWNNYEFNKMFPQSIAKVIVLGVLADLKNIYLSY